MRESAAGQASPLPGHVRIAIIGAGFGGIGAGIRLLHYSDVLDRTRVAALDARPAAEQRWNAGIQQRMRPTVWMTGGCVSWYLNPAGRNPTLWPGSVGRFRRATRHLDLAEYTLLPAGAG